MKATKQDLTFQDIIEQVDLIVERATECREIYPEFKYLHSYFEDLEIVLLKKLFQHYADGLKCDCNLSFQYWMLFDDEPHKIMNKEKGTIAYHFYVRAHDVEITFESKKYNIKIGKEVDNVEDY